MGSDARMRPGACSWIVLTSIVIAPLCGCGGSSSGETATEPQVSATVTEFCRSAVEAIVRYESRCFGGSVEMWRAIFESLNCDATAASAAAGRLAYDPARAAACLSQLEQASCTNSTDSVDCAQAVVGQANPGGACNDLHTVFSECAPGSYCDAAAYACGGTCRQYAPAGGSCALPATGTRVRCAPHTSCDTTTNICVADAAEGQPCGSCVTTQYCDRAGADGGTSVSGVCRPRQTSGACPTGVECQTGYTCSTANGAKTCVRWKFTGEACIIGQNECYPLTYCGADGRCSADGAPGGASCGKQANGETVRCARGFFCASNSTCQPQKPPGSVCTTLEYGACAGANGHCDASTSKCVSCG
jgi:hypothetical protein